MRATSRRAHHCVGRGSYSFSQRRVGAPPCHIGLGYHGMTDPSGAWHDRYGDLLSRADGLPSRRFVQLTVFLIQRCA